MQWIHDAHPDRRVRLAYCLNLHAADDLEGTLEGVRAITLPLAERLSGGRPFGVGMYLPGEVALALDEADLARLTRFVLEADLDPFTFNAFPFGGFQTDGQKTDVYRPTWMEEERTAFTVAVARAADHLARARGEAGAEGGRHVSISTHPGGFAAWMGGRRDLERCAHQLARCAAELVRIEAAGGTRIVLALEAEPRSSANDSAELASYLEWARPYAAGILVEELGFAPDDARTAVTRHLGTCLDCCHSAVEFEDPARALEQAARGGPLGKLQFSSALALRAPGSDAAAREALLAMDEPRFLHQVTGTGGSPVPHCDDLPELARALADERAESWLACDEWRCHFHVPVDLETLGEGLGTTQAHAARLLDGLLARPADWTTPELHLEIETYTWSVLPGAARGTGELVDGLEREYRHVMALLERAGWRRA